MLTEKGKLNLLSVVCSIGLARARVAAPRMETRDLMETILEILIGKVRLEM